MLAHGLRFDDLYDDAGAARIDDAFRRVLAGADAALAARLDAARAAPDALDRLAESQLLIAVAPHLEDFLGDLFGIGHEVRALEARHHALAPLFTVRRQFVQRKAVNAYKGAAADALDGPALRAALEARIGAFDDLGFAHAVLRWQDEAADVNADAANAGAANADALDLALRYAAWATQTAAGKAAHKGSVLFRVPRKLDFFNLVPLIATTRHGVSAFETPAGHLRRREGFALTDAGTDLAGGLAEAHYCIWCHEQGKDSCAHGLVDKKSADPAGAPFKASTFGVPLAGCPLEERISEFNKLRADGYPLGALAMICIDNPMVAATGHRICNDCMKSCIYQKQDPVDIPQSETRVLKDVLALPWGFEIYSLLTRWNPLNLRRPLPKPATGKRVLVVGMGPAGITLAHHLINDGHTVVAIDGLKIEPLAADLCGPDFAPVRDFAAIEEPLDQRVMAGFGGVAEYGITVRWNKNFLKVVRVLLERRARFALHGGVRFGGTLTGDGAFALGFDHVALALGAGRPTVLELPNGLANGVRTASDFLMALQLTGAAKAESLANMQLRLPVVVIGGGLTAIDTATESLAYYPMQVEKFLARHEALCAAQSRDVVESRWTPAEREIAAEFIAHARAIRAEREAAARENRAPRIVELLREWGGVTIAYRRRLVDSPSYTLNHEEVDKALEEGIWFSEGLTPLAIEVDADNRARGLAVSEQHNDGDGVWHEYARATLPARTILIAAGTQPNTVLAREDGEHFHLDGKYFRLLGEDGQPVKPVRGHVKPDVPAVLTDVRDDGRAVSFFGDLHPSYHGNVVKAMASAKSGYPIVSRMLGRVAAASADTDAEFFARIDDELAATVESINRLTPTIVEVVIKAKAAARRFAPGQFYRLQNYESSAARVEGSRLGMEGLALTGAWVDRDKGLVSTIVLEMGGSSDLCSRLAPGDPVVLMGPTGMPTEIEPGETVLLAGGGLGNAVLFSIGRAFRDAGSKVLYFAAYRRAIDRYKVDDIEAAADIVVWCCDEAPGFTPRRAQDRAYVGNVVDAMRAYAEGRLGDVPDAGADARIALQSVKRIIAIGSDRMMAAVAAARHGILAPYLDPAHRAIGSINSPMQCMMKEVCAQCLQPHRDPVTGKVSYVFSCFNQDQPLDDVDFTALASRLAQNGLQEKLTARWLGHLQDTKPAIPVEAPGD
jgi:NADPH-dependent glutamate synthase beta subunit-like oxidoreductase/NAD(P)H-flavin reductase